MGFFEDTHPALVFMLSMLLTCCGLALIVGVPIALVLRRQKYQELQDPRFFELEESNDEAHAQPCLFCGGAGCGKCRGNHQAKTPCLCCGGAGCGLCGGTSESFESEQVEDRQIPSDPEQACPADVAVPPEQPPLPMDMYKGSQLPFCRLCPLCTSGSPRLQESEQPADQMPLDVCLTFEDKIRTDVEDEGTMVVEEVGPGEYASGSLLSSLPVPTEPPQLMAIEARQLAVGDKVKLHGLIGRSSLNGRVATVSGDIEHGKNRWPLSLPTGERISIRACNMQLVAFA